MGMCIVPYHELLQEVSYHSYYLVRKRSCKDDLLFWVICGVCEYPWIDPPNDTVKALDDYTISICLNKVVIQ